MTEKYIYLGQHNYKITLVTLNTAIIGSGAAGLNAADRLNQYGQKDIAIVTEGINIGTSRNTGSDKQTYYKLSLSGKDLDSVADLAQELFAGQCVDGDIALCEAALSAQCFLRLVDLGVPFPQNRYGEFVGYKTDHDTKHRATSVGPYTSRMMTECLERSVRKKEIKIYDGLQVVKMFAEKDKILGFLCVDKKAKCYEDCFILFNCKNVIFATGGPAGMYAKSAFPLCHFGATGLAFGIGAKGKNLMEWQFGLASKAPRWNVSGTYMQALPTFISTDYNGNDAREFLGEFFASKEEMLSTVFLKGYQWPFDVRKVRDGSSIIDILVYIETELKGRRVFLDFQKNPGDEEINYSLLSLETREYLQKSGACFGTPFERLEHMNAPAVSFYAERGHDLKRQPLEISLCAQHNNGGLDIDCWWQTNIEGLFAVGEVAASHGVYRPGGSALNAGQVGSTRAAQYIAERRSSSYVSDEMFLSQIDEKLGMELEKLEAITDNNCTIDNVGKYMQMTSERMSRTGGAVRNLESIKSTCGELEIEIISFCDNIQIRRDPQSVANALRLEQTLICQYVYLSSMQNYIENGGKSRGSALYTDENGKLPWECIPEIFRFSQDDDSCDHRIQIVEYDGKECTFEWRPARKIPEEDNFFENVWCCYRQNKNIY